jgi:hypothetical protein
MPNKKAPREMTDEELALRIFPKKVKEELDKLDSIVKTPGRCGPSRA